MLSKTCKQLPIPRPYYKNSQFQIDIQGKREKVVYFTIYVYNMWGVVCAIKSFYLDFLIPKRKASISCQETSGNSGMSWHQRDLVCCVAAGCAIKGHLGEKTASPSGTTNRAVRNIHIQIFFLFFCYTGFCLHTKFFNDS